jgi:hypothetical protein
LGIEQVVKLQWKSLPQKPLPKAASFREYRLNRSRNDSPQSLLNFVAKSPSLPPHISSENSARLIGLLPESLYDLFFHCKISSGEEFDFGYGFIRMDCHERANYRTTKVCRCALKETPLDASFPDDSAALLARTVQNDAECPTIQVLDHQDDRFSKIRVRMTRNGDQKVASK